MPSEFPRSPKPEKGALVVYESLTPGTKPKITIRFLYNKVAPDAVVICPIRTLIAVWPTAWRRASGSCYEAFANRKQER